ncbi:acylphosphatase [Actinobacillus minor]|uniref:acylphosphatase n=1 Tax=Actinobacillus minor TaxID=51047 RepID=UPI0023F4A34F|nr:acylphosphatase [Actinobacillus minor]MDD6909757.1 acylphosphatase [Actinobacillus minor]MDY4713089.1 acylphosphatase [Actinobacillus minor]
MQTKQFFVFGLVQGVGFRFFTLQEAKQIGVTGYVKNREDGSVAVVAQGSEAQIQQLRLWLSKGPRTSQVERVIEQNYQTNERFEQFIIKA